MLRTSESCTDRQDYGMLLYGGNALKRLLTFLARLMMKHSEKSKTKRLDDEMRANVVEKNNKSA